MLNGSAHACLVSTGYTARLRTNPSMLLLYRLIAPYHQWTQSATRTSEGYPRFLRQQYRKQFQSPFLLWSMLCGVSSSRCLKFTKRSNITRCTPSTNGYRQCCRRSWDLQLTTCHNSSTHSIGSTLLAGEHYPAHQFAVWSWNAVGTT